jgi:2-polyprenyl-3-methyl-5-hydroxy-6-metoxy-1,4-benzoquinol methylase
MTIPHKPASLTPSSAWDPAELETLGHCPICQSTARRVLYQDLTDTLFGCAPGRWTLHTCNACRTAYLDPRPTADSIGKAYAQYCTHPEPAGDTPDQGVPVRGSALLTFARATLNSYRNVRWQMALTPSNGWGRYVVPWFSPACALVEQQMRHMPPHPAGRQGRLLDVGCGNGTFLKLAQKAGWSVHGIDFDPIAVAEARNGGLDIYLGSIDQLTAQEQTYDWITCSHVLEHVHEPQNLLHLMQRLLRPGGTLWLQTPNIDSVGHRIHGANWIGVDPPRHLTLMATQTLRQTLESTGFKTHFYRLPALSAMAVYAASNALGNGKKNAMTLSHSRIFRLRFLLPAIVQSWSLRHTEFHTVIATRR